jgi:hypothetical protein
MLGSARRRSSHPAPADGRVGWFEGVREGRLCGWAFVPGDTSRILEVTLTSSAGAMLTVRADRFRADLQAAGGGDGWHGFSAPTTALPGAESAASCTWSDLGLALPGSPWSAPRRPGRRYRAGSVTLLVDTPAAGDPRLTGYVRDRAHPLRRLTLAAVGPAGELATTIASLYRDDQGRPAGDGFHGFMLPLPTPPRLIEGFISIVDADHDRVLARLGSHSL